MMKGNNSNANGTGETSPKESQRCQGQYRDRCCTRPRHLCNEKQLAARSCCLVAELVGGRCCGDGDDGGSGGGGSDGGDVRVCSGTRNNASRGCCDDSTNTGEECGERDDERHALTIEYQYDVYTKTI